jgi:hypothetical protein
MILRAREFFGCDCKRAGLDVALVADGLSKLVRSSRCRRDGLRTDLWGPRDVLDQRNKSSIRLARLTRTVACQHIYLHRPSVVAAFFYINAEYVLGLTRKIANSVRR